MAQRDQLLRSKSGSSGSGIWGMLRSVATNPLVSSGENISQLKEEVAALEDFSRQLLLEAVDMHSMRERIEWAKTFRGKYFNVMGYFFSLYCLWKIFIVSISFC